MIEYEQFVETKLSRIPPTGMTSIPQLSESLFPFQRDLVRWALRRGRCALFAATGLGKSRMQVEWARHVVSHTQGRVLVLAPLAVSNQTAEEAAKLGVCAQVCRDASEIDAKIVISNYERLHRFDPRSFDGVVCDESSIIKHKDSKTLRMLLDAFRDTQFKLCATATPSPNDYTELGTHAEFLGICTSQEMLAEYFCHDGGETQVWRLKGHARAEFWRWVASWGALVRAPSDLGYDDGGYALPPLHVHEHIIPADKATVQAAGLLFAAPAGDLTERRTARRASLRARVSECVARVNANSRPWVVWCDLNDESDALTAAIDGAIEVRGSMDVDDKESRIRSFLDGKSRVLVTKPSIAGFGLNLQFCSDMGFVGVTDSWEAYHQAVRRIWRFGQKQECNVHIWASEVEGSVVANLKRKEADAIKMANELSRETGAVVRDEVLGQRRSTNEYSNRALSMPAWLSRRTPDAD